MSANDEFEITLSLEDVKTLKHLLASSVFSEQVTDGDVSFAKDLIDQLSALGVE